MILPVNAVLQNEILAITGTKPIGYWEAEETKLDIFEKYTLIDGGAFIGDSISAILSYTKSQLTHAYCFEPDNKNASILKQFINKESLSDITTIFNMGLGDKEMTVEINEKGTVGANLVNCNNGYTKVVCLDNIDLIVKGKLCIKLDIEGYELAALRGATNIIKKYKPELAICVYHKNDDVYEIPAFIKSIVPEYNFLLRGSWHMVCMASVERYK
jgi:FkbM family methyltransferase